MSSIKETAGKPKNKNILRQVVLFSFILFTLFIIINGVMTYHEFTKYFVSELQNLTDNTKLFAKDIVQRYSSISWLLDYWQENYETLDVSRKSTYWEKYSGLPSEILADIKKVSSEQANSLSPEHQKLFAELCYREMLVDLDALRENMKVYSIYIVKHLTKDSFVYYYNDEYSDTSDQENDVYLGEIFPHNMSKHPLLMELYASEGESSKFERFSVDPYSRTGKREEFVVGHTLLRENGKVIASITVQFWESDLKKSIFSGVWRIVLINVLCFVFLGMTLFSGLNLQILKPLLKIQEYVRKYTTEKDSSNAVNSLQTIKSQNEIGRLADDFSSLAVELEHYTNETAELSAEKAKIASELSLAASIQMDALPKEFPDEKEFKLFATLKPAQDVGGDLYDFFMLDDEHIALVIGDVSGKGISAALFMMKVKTELKASALLGNGSPKEIITSLNEKLCDENDAMMFVTLWFGIMNINTGEIVYVNAGHEYPIIRAENGLFEVNKSAHTPPLGLMPNNKLKEERLTMKPGDTIFLYTDGVPEANNVDSEQFGLDKTLDVLNEKPDSEPEELVNSLLRSINDFAGNAPQFDDTTILCVKYFG